MQLLATGSAWVLFCIGSAAAVVWLVCVLPPFGSLLSPPCGACCPLPTHGNVLSAATTCAHAGRGYPSVLLLLPTTSRHLLCPSSDTLHKLGQICMTDGSHLPCVRTGRGYVASMLLRGAQATATVAKGVTAPVVLVVLLHHGTNNSDSITVHWVVCCALPTCGCVSCRAQQVCMHM